MNDTEQLDDQDIRAAVTNAGDRPTEHFRAELRALLADGVSDGRSVVRSTPTTSTPWRPTWQVTLAVAATLALVVGGLAIIGSRDRSLVAPGTVPDSVDAVPSMLDQLTGKRWVATGHTGALVPWISIDGEIVTGFDGCNQYGGTWHALGDLLDEVSLDGTAMDCGDRIALVPNAGDRLVQEADGFGLVDADGNTRASFAALDAYPIAASADDIVGVKNLDPGHNVQILDNEYFAIGTCAVTWTFDGGLRVTNWPTDPGSFCLEPDAIDAQRLIEMLQAGNAVEARSAGEDILLVDEGTVIRLSECGGTDCTSVAQVEDVDRLLAQVGGRRWVLDNSDSGYPFGLLPFIELPTDPSATPMISGYDGCNWFGLRGSWVPDDGWTGFVAISDDASVESTAIGCAEGRGGIAPVAGDAFIPEGDRLVVRGPDDRKVLEYVPLDVLRPVADKSGLVGTWSLDDGATELTFDEGLGRFTFGGCSWQWAYDGRLTTDGSPSDPYSCLSGGADETSSRLIEVLVAGRPSDVLTVADGSQLYIVSDDGQFMIRLRLIRR